jgi:large subunit ribosomal protein L9
MELILKKTVDTLGEEGDLVKVKPGYGRNYPGKSCY